MEKLTREYVMDVLQALSPKEELVWLQSFGAALTIAARAVYDAEQAANGLRGFNGIQHRVFGRIHSLQNGHAWPLEEFLDDCARRAKYFEIECDFGAALRLSLKPFRESAV